MSLLVDTSVWSLALRRDAPPEVAEVAALRTALIGRERVVTTGLILQELLQGAVRARSRKAITARFDALELLLPTRDDHVSAAEVRATCRAGGVQLGTVDALLVALCLAHGLTMLTTDHDFHCAAAHVDLRVWRNGVR